MTWMLQCLGLIIVNDTTATFKLFAALSITATTVFHVIVNTEDVLVTTDLLSLVVMLCITIVLHESDIFEAFELFQILLWSELQVVNVFQVKASLAIGL